MCPERLSSHLRNPFPSQSRAPEKKAKNLEKRLLILDTRVGDPSETLYDKKGYIKFGTVPGYALNSSNDFDDMAFYFKII